jgi:aminopeptidase YwaD
MRPRILCPFVVLLTLAACRGSLSERELADRTLRAEKESRAGMQLAHRGAAVARGTTGTARFADRVFAAFSSERALATTAFMDRWYREPGNDGFEAVLDDLHAKLSAAGYGRDEGLELEWIVTPLETKAWTPLSARLAVVEPNGKERVLHAFERSEDRDRTMLPVNAPSAEVEGTLVTRLEDVVAGSVLLTDGPLGGDVLRDAQAQGAALVIAADLAEHNVDPSGKQRHLDAIAYRSVSAGGKLAVCQISPRSAADLHAQASGGRPLRVRFRARVELSDRPLRTLVATIAGERRANEAIVLVAHVQEPGACDNASGVATLLECARVCASTLASGELDRPERSISFVFGDEIAQSRIFLEHTRRKVFASLTSEMTGESFEQTGAQVLLERTPDPGALRVLPPDEHTAWGAEAVAAADLHPNGLALIARSALLDVGALSTDWKSAEHPFEGGSDHVVFLERGVPAVLFWHFPDFAYHTSLDRMEHVDPDEMRRTGAALLSTALAVADPRPDDLQRYLESLRLEQELRLGACAAVGDEETARHWRDWFHGARHWLRMLCLGERAAADELQPSGSASIQHETLEQKP